MENCIFCNIANKESPADIVYEDDQFLVFPDINPKAPLHLLVIPKKHIESLQDVTEHDTELMGNLLITAQKVAKQKQLAGYKLAMNVGRAGGQEIDHLHLHLLSQQS